MKRAKINIALFAAMLGSALAAKAQQPQKVGDNTVDVTYQYRPKISDAVKIDVNPVPETQVAEKPDMQYTTQPTPMDIKVQKTKLPAPSIKGDKLEELHHNFVKLGVGNYSNIYAEYFFNTLRDRNKLFTAHLLHHSGTGPINSSNFGNEHIDLYGRKLFGKTALDANIGFHQDSYHWYGQLPKDTTGGNKKPFLKQAFMNFNLGLNFENAGAAADAFHYKAGAGFYTFSDKYNTSENDIRLAAKGIEPVKDNRIEINAAFDYMTYKFNKAESRTFTAVDAAYVFRTHGLRLNAGLKTANESDSFGSKFHAYPDIKAEADVVDKYVTVFAAITGGLDKVTYQSLATENPFIMPGSPLRNTNKKFEISGGIKGSLSSRTVYKASIAYRNYQNLYFFMNAHDSTGKFSRTFVPMYDTGTTTVLNFNAEIGYTISDRFNLNTSLDLNNYSVSAIAKPFERPAMKWMLTGRYNVDKKVIFTADAYVLGKRWAGVVGQSDSYKTLPPVLDFNAGVTYVFSNLKGLQAFIEAQNLMANQYQLWNYYPERGFQIIGGVKLSFL
jgi:hypothetical protein